MSQPDSSKEVPETVQPAATEQTTASSLTSAKQTLDEAARSMALKQWEQAADQYAVALEALSGHYAEDAPALAPILHRYGRCLLEHAIATSGALGSGGGGSGAAEAPMPKRKATNGKATGSSSSGAEAGSSKDVKSTPASDPRFSFGGDADDQEDDEEEDGEDGPAGDGQEDDGDDLSTAFAVLDLARVIYQRLLRGGKDEEDAVDDVSVTLETIDGKELDYTTIKMSLAEVLNDLGDVGLESENFQQASSDYQTSLVLLSPLLHPHSRRLADAYLRLGLALEFHPDQSQQETAINFVTSASNVLKTRLQALKQRQVVLSTLGGDEAKVIAAAAELREVGAGQARENGEPTTSIKDDDDVTSAKGKGQSIEQRIVEKDDVLEMTESKVDREVKDVEEMIGELQAKIDEYEKPTTTATTASEGQGDSLPASAKMALQEAIDEVFLGKSTNGLRTTGSATTSTGPVNDLSGMVKRKKRPVEEQEMVGAAVKGKETKIEEAAEGGDSKKARLEDA